MSDLCRPAFALTVFVMVALVMGERRSGASEPSAPDRLPSPEAVRAADRVVKQTFDGDARRLQTEAKRTLLDTMRSQAFDPKNEPTVRYAILLEAAKLATSIGDVNAVIWVSDALADTYPHASLGVRSSILDDAARASTSAPARLVLADALIGVADDAAWAGNFDRALRIAESARAIAGTGDITEKTRVFRDIVEHLSAQRQGGAGFGSQGSTREGVLLCFGTGDWAKGLPMLVRGDDPLLASVAGTELDRERQLLIRNLKRFIGAVVLGPRAAQPVDASREAGLSGSTQLEDPLTPSEMVALADGYMQVARSHSRSPLARSGAAARATVWYERAMSALGGIARVTIEKQLAESRQLALLMPRDLATENLRDTALSFEWTWPGEDVQMTFRENGEVSHRGMHGMWRLDGPHAIILRTDEGDVFRLHFNEALTRYIGLGNDLRIEGSRVDG